MKRILPLFLFAVALLSCEKEKISADDLTQCAPNSNCSYLFTENSGIDSARVIPGNRRVFISESTTATSVSRLLISAPADGNTFTLDKSAIRSGFTAYAFSCINCDNIPLHPVDGQVKGEKADRNRWLIDARIVLAGPQNDTPVDTLYVKQYFSLKN